MKKRDPKFKPGTVVVFDPASFNPNFWDKLPEEDRIKYYGPLGYGSDKIKLFIYMSEINDSGHCVLIDMDTNENVIMRHTSDFRPATEEEF
jgi:hypothetical protein